MRFIVNEQRYEERIGSGQFRYSVDGRPTGAVENWRLTGAPDGHTILRVDLDARAAASGHSYLYHLVRDGNGRPQRLAYRFWGGGLAIDGTLLFDTTSITGTREVNGIVYEEDLNLPGGYLFWFPSAAGLGLILSAPGTAAVPAATLNGRIGGTDTLALQSVSAAVTMMITDTVDVTVAGRKVTAVPVTLRWADQRRFITRDEQFWPLVMERPGFAGGKLLTATETQYIWQRKRITGPGTAV
jgi:hypothetical protein